MGRHTAEPSRSRIPADTSQISELTTRASRRAAEKRGHSRRRHSTPRRFPSSLASTAASVAIMAITTGTAGAVYLPTAQQNLTPEAEPASDPRENTTATSSLATSATPVDQHVLDEASLELVRAERIATEAAGSLSPEQQATIQAVRAQLTAALDETTIVNDTPSAESDSASSRTNRVSRDASREALDTPGSTATSPAESPAETPTPPAEANAATSTETAVASPEVAAEISTLTSQLRTVLNESQAALEVQVVPAPPTAEEIATQRAQELEQNVARWANSTQGYSNGRLPENVLCGVSFAPGALLRCDAADQLEKLNAEFSAHFGHALSITDSYRSYGEQVATKRAKGYLAAKPGTSNHGWGVAIDVKIGSYSDEAYLWLREHGPGFGWDNPTWARPGGSKNEPWHWEFLTGE